MIVVTGGAGFIGSNLHAALAERGIETVVVDRLRANGKWRNLAKHPPVRLVRPETLDDFLATNPPVKLIFHLGAVSETTASDGDWVWETNVELPLRLWHWCAAHGARLIYASSAATYGDGTLGFDDDPALLERLRPLNLYGWTKHAFDLRVHRTVARKEERPPQWVGLKFFNVYGPNENHKGAMISVVKAKYDEIVEGRPVTLFRSDRPDIPDGAQKRDFVYVGDVVNVLVWLIDHPEVSGLFNVGTGRARSYLELAHAVCDALDAPRRVGFVDMPKHLLGQYQSFTEARVDRLRAAGYAARFLPIEEGVRRYVTEYLQATDSYR
jgi:ADP-L-glycero-D-manno-heptose 6-epimerase